MGGTALGGLGGGVLPSSPAPAPWHPWAGITSPSASPAHGDALVGPDVLFHLGGPGLGRNCFGFGGVRCGSLSSLSSSECDPGM